MDRTSRRELIGLAAGLGLAGTLWKAWPQHRADGAGHPSLPENQGPTRRGEAGGPPPRTGGRPARLQIPTIGFDRSVVALGTNDEGQIVPPVQTVQWYTGSAQPGQAGIAVIAGHVTSPRPDVFYRLSDVRIGDVVTVIDHDDHTFRFAIHRTGRVGKRELTRDPSVWGHAASSTLVLITCDDHSPLRGQHYTRNFVAWASLSDS